jgi:hypothetical protein
MDLLKTAPPMFISMGGAVFLLFNRIQLDLASLAKKWMVLKTNFKDNAFYDNLNL